MRTAVSAHDVAAELRQRLPGVGAKKLHKLLYYCQGHHLATFDAPLFSETISAWDMGPVVGALWYQEKEHGIAPLSAPLDEAALNTVGYVLSRYGALSGSDLEHLTHSEDPWVDANSRRSPGTSVRIPHASITAYVRQTAGDEDEQGALLPDAAEVAAWLKAAGQDTAEGVDSVDEIRARIGASAG